MTNMKKAAVLTLLALVALTSGCTITSVKMADGTKFSSYRFADLTKIGKIDAQINTNRFTMEGYDSDRQTAAIEANKTAQMALERIPKTVP